MAATQQVRIVAAEDAAVGVRRLKLAPLGGGILPGWDAGSHIDLVLPSGLVRQYSLCGSPADRSEYEISVLCARNGRGGSVEVHDLLQAGDVVSIAGPRNHFPLYEAQNYVFVAGGIGITPLLPMIEEVHRLGRGWQLIYGGRSRSSMAYLDRLAQWPGNVRILPQDEFGLLDLDRLLTAQPGTLVYCCGPEPLLQAVTARCLKDWPEATLNFERFSADPVAPVPATANIDNAAFAVQLGEEGPLVPVPADKTILQSLLDVGADVLYSCEEGTCGSCETQVLSGEPDHRDGLLSQKSRDSGCMLLCVSRSNSPLLVLDIDPPPHLTGPRLQSQTSA